MKLYLLTTAFIYKSSEPIYNLFSSLVLKHAFKSSIVCVYSSAVNVLTFILTVIVLALSLAPKNISPFLFQMSLEDISLSGMVGISAETTPKPAKSDTIISLYLK